MPGMSGFEILERMRSDPQLQYTPVIVLTAADDPETKHKALEIGAGGEVQRAAQVEAQEQAREIGERAQPLLEAVKVGGA